MNDYDKDKRLNLETEFMGSNSGHSAIDYLAVILTSKKDEITRNKEIASQRKRNYWNVDKSSKNVTKQKYCRHFWKGHK